MKLGDLKLPYLILFISGIAITFSLPFIPIDETRYLTVAWEMKLNNSFIVPILNGLPYSHKPPFLFWLINIDWLIFGINEITLRFIPLLFSLMNIGIVYKLSLILSENKKTARYATIILASSLLYFISSSLIMFDIILTFWVLIGMAGMILSAKKTTKAAWLLISLSIGGGLITKGPVIFVHLLPVYILYFFWRSEDYLELKKWYIQIFFSIIIGVCLALIWVVPAAILGGEAYRDAILWGQTANRIVSSFAHQRPVWWYIPLLPIFVFPWIFLKPVWSGYGLVKQNKNIHFLLVWILSPLIIFSLISGKQIHYLIPIMPAISLLIAQLIMEYDKSKKTYNRMHYPLSIFYMIAGIFLLFLPLLKLRGDVGNIAFDSVLYTAIGIIIMGSSMLLIKVSSMANSIKLTAVSSVLFSLIIIIGSNKIFARYDLSHLSQILKEKQDEGYTIVNYGEYPGQYQFLGRLTQPILAIENKDSLNLFIKNNNSVLLLTYEKQNTIVDEKNTFFQQLYRGKKVILWKDNKYFLSQIK